MENKEYTFTIRINPGKIWDKVTYILPKKRCKEYFPSETYARCQKQIERFNNSRNPLKYLGLPRKNKAEEVLYYLRGYDGQMPENASDISGNISVIDRQDEKDIAYCVGLENMKPYSFLSNPHIDANVKVSKFKLNRFTKKWGLLDYCYTNKDDTKFPIGRSSGQKGLFRDFLSRQLDNKNLEGCINKLSNKVSNYYDYSESLNNFVNTYKKFGECVEKVCQNIKLINEMKKGNE